MKYLLKFKHFEDYDFDMEDTPREEYQTIKPILSDQDIDNLSEYLKDKLKFLGWKFNAINCSSSRTLTTYKGRKWLYNINYERFQIDTDYNDTDYSILDILSRSFFDESTTTKDCSAHPLVKSQPWFYNIEIAIAPVTIKDFDDKEAVWTINPKTIKEGIELYCNRLIKLSQSFTNQLDLQFKEILMDNDDIKIVLISYINNMITNEEDIPQIILEKLSKAIHRCNFSLKEIDEFKTQNPTLFNIMEKYMGGELSTASKLNDLGF